LWQELRAQRGFEGSYEVVKLAVRPLRQAASAAASDAAALRDRPGRAGAVDWGQAMVPMGGVRRPVHIFVMTLGYSRRGYAEGFLRRAHGEPAGRP
jgi:transposase